MPLPLALIRLAERVPVLLPGATLHRAGLRALAGGDAALAERLFERAALACRRDVEVERLARVRVHQLMARCRAERDGAVREALELEVERRLCRLPFIETLDPPYELVEAGRLLAVWAGPVDGSERAAA